MTLCTVQSNCLHVHPTTTSHVSFAHWFAMLGRDGDAVVSCSLSVVCGFFVCLTIAVVLNLWFDCPFSCFFFDLTLSSSSLFLVAAVCKFRCLLLLLAVVVAFSRVPVS